MKEIVSNPNLVAYCGLYCGACRKYLNEKCPGCHENKGATWCKIRSCCTESHFSSCADCNQFQDPTECRKFNNVISKIFGLIFRSDRAACITQIREIGVQGHADKMANLKQHTIRK